MEKQTISRTLFVRNLPYTTTNEALEEFFSDTGPVKRCFVVKDKDSANLCRGYGYVTFSSFEDAQEAKEKIKQFEGRNIQLIFSLPKAKKKKKDMAEEENVEEDTKRRQQPVKERGENKSTGDGTRASVTKQMHMAACTVVLSNLSKEIKLSDIKKMAGTTEGVANVEFPTCESGKALIRYSSKAEAVKAAKILSTTKLKGSSVMKVLRQSQEMILSSSKYLQRCKLIVRNLAFKCTPESLKKAFENFGNVMDASIPQDPNGKKKGFGFVQFSRLEDASAALQEMNTKQIEGRPVAVDWAMPKNKFQASLSKLESSSQEAKSDTAHEESDEGSSSAESDTDLKSKGGSKGEKSKRLSSHDDSEEEEDDDGDDDDDSGDSDDSTEEDDSEDMVEDTSSGDEIEGEDDSDEDEDETDDDFSSDSSDEGFSEKDKKRKGSFTKRKDLKEDVEEGKTLFIRNLSFDTEEEDLEERFEEFGELVYCKIVIDPNTEKSRGTAFVKFESKEGAEKCLAYAADISQEGVVIDKRKLNITLALPKKKAAELKKKDDEKDTKDKRNLWLVREGMIRQGTQAAEGLSKIDLAKREKVEQIKRQKLKNPSVFVSTTRLCVRNLPPPATDAQVKKIFLNAAKDRSAVITECRIMRDMQRVNSKGVGKSRGYGFVNFTEHKHALQALRSVNNNPDIFGDKKRLIVEFSLENKAALMAKERKLERFKTRQLAKASQKKGEDTNTTSKKQKKMKKGKAKMKPTDIVKSVIPKDEEEIEKRKKIPKGLPSHHGAKVRHNPRNTVVPGKKSKHKSNRDGKNVQQKRKIEEYSGMDIPDRKKSRKSGKGGKKEQRDNFDRLVSKYKKNRSSGMKTQKKTNTSKWFD